MLLVFEDVFVGCLLGASKTRKSNWLADCCRYMQEERMGTHARDLFVVLPPVTHTSSSEVAAVENSSKLSSPSPMHPNPGEENKYRNSWINYLLTPKIEALRKQIIPIKSSPPNRLGRQSKKLRVVVSCGGAAVLSFLSSQFNSC